MDSAEFKETIIRLAKDDTVGIRAIQALLTRYFKGKPLPHIQSDQAFVVRCGVNAPGEVFRNVSRCSYPPDERTNLIKMQRANYAGQQVFYCSLPTNSEHASSSTTCIVETAWEYIEDLNAGRTYLTLSRWQNSRPLQLWVLPFSEESCQKNNDFRNIRKNMLPILQKAFPDDPEKIESLEFISNLFCEKEDRSTSYRITSAFYNSLLFFEKMTGCILDGLMYPSANTEKAGINLVLKKELVDSGILRCDLAMMWTMQRNPSNPKNLNIMPASNEAYPEPFGKLRFSFIS